MITPLPSVITSPQRRQNDMEQPLENGTAVTMIVDGDSDNLMSPPVSELSNEVNQQDSQSKGLRPASIWKTAFVASVFIICSNLYTTWLIVSRNKNRAGDNLMKRFVVPVEYTTSFSDRSDLLRNVSTSSKEEEEEYVFQNVSILRTNLNYVLERYKDGYVIIFEGRCQDYTTVMRNSDGVEVVVAKRYYNGSYTLPVSVYSTELYWIQKQDETYEYHTMTKLDGTVALGFRCKNNKINERLLSECQAMSELVCKPLEKSIEGA